MELTRSTQYGFAIIVGAADLCSRELRVQRMEDVPEEGSMAHEDSWGCARAQGALGPDKQEWGGGGQTVYTAPPHEAPGMSSQ